MTLGAINAAPTLWCADSHSSNLLTARLFLKQRWRAAREEPLPMKLQPLCIRPPPGLEPPCSWPTDNADMPAWLQVVQDGTFAYEAQVNPVRTSHELTQDAPLKASAKMKKPKSPPPQPLPPGPCVGQAKAKTGAREAGRATCKFYLDGYTSDEHKDFDLVPRIIGHAGRNMRAIASKACKVRIRGRGSGQLEKTQNGVAREADLPLHIALSCSDAVELEIAKEKLDTLLQGISVHFYRFCRKMGLEEPARLYRLA
ncbi:Zc3h3 [Symbiodinium natans]|uniref:Zc3h3 protein n=1 Tax=Symbiodinium natans TaxID=878477 RepID=A0A812S2S3_9DINO|nr:Zc3h3 [Symbiodinium natans]